MGNQWTSIFGGSAIKPSDPQFEPIALSADIALVWPLESANGVPYVAALMNVTPTTSGLYIAMPAANQGSTGVAGIIQNVGADDFTLTDTSGNQLGVIATGEAWVIVLADNSDADGEWQLLQLGALTSNAQAGALAGDGLEAYLTRLRSRISTFTYSADHALDSSHRAGGVIFTGATGTFALDPAATLTDGWWCLVANQGSGNLTISTTDKIDGAASLVLPPSGTTEPYSTLIVCDGTAFNTFAGTPVPTPISAGGTGATNAGAALANLGGTATGIAIFTAASTAAVLALLGISQSLLRESTISTGQSIAAGASGTAFVCTAALPLTLAEADTLTNAFFLMAYAQGGAVTLVPAATDSINGGSAGANLVIPQGQSFLLVTDAATPGNWWVFFLPTSTTAAPGTWAIAGGTVNAITATYSPPNTSLTDGLELNFRATGANTTVSPTFAPDALAAQIITKDGGAPLALGDIPGQYAECKVRYNLANTRWELQNPAVTEPPWAAAGGAADAITATYTPTIPALYDGLLLGFRATAANATTTPTFAPNGLTAHTITKNGGVALAAGDIAGINFEAQVRYNLANTRWELLNPAASGGGGGGNALPGGFSNLKISISSTTVVALTADSAVLGQTPAGPSFIDSAISVSMDITTSGANGLDTGVVAPGTGYAVWLIYNGVSIAGLLSLSGTSPTLPGGYTYATRFGWVLTDGAANLVNTLQKANKVRYISPPLPAMASGSSGSITIPSWTPVAVSAFVPPTASAIMVVAQATGTNGTVIVAPNNSYGAWNNTSNTPPMVVQSGGSSATDSESIEMLLESGSIYWASAGSSNRLYCYGWTDNL